MTDRRLAALALLFTLAALLLLLHGAQASSTGAPFGAPPPGPQADGGLVPVFARALRSVVRRWRERWRATPALG